MLCSTALFITCVLPGSAQQTTARKASSEVLPNIVLIVADDQRTDTIGAHGQHGISTPNLDRFVREGTSFRRAYCLGSPHGAVCAPSRAMLHSGRPYFRINHGNLEGSVLLGERLREAGYHAIATGKWHNGQDSFVRSFDVGRSVMFGGMSDHRKVPIVDVGPDGKPTERREGEQHSTDLFTDAALGLLAEAPTDRPFFLNVAYTAPHDPRDPVEAYRDRELPPLPDNFLPQHPFDNSSLTVRDEKLAGWPREPEVIRRQLAEYYGLIEHMDAAIGRIVEYVESRETDRPTIWVYVADHGLALGSHGLLGKQSVYEHSLRAPMIVSGPGIPQGRELTSLVYLLDLNPTILSFAGLEPGEDCFGRDLAPLWRGDVAEVRSSLFLSMGRAQRAVTDGRWKLCVYPNVAHRQLFDLASDPTERIDLATRPAFQHHIARLSRELDVQRALVGDTDPLVVDEPKPLVLDLTGRHRKPDRHQPQWIRDEYFPPPPEEADADKR